MSGDAQAEIGELLTEQLDTLDLRPGLYDGIPEDAYHSHPSLSSTGARRILPPGCPASFRWDQLNGRPDKRTFDFGHAAHALVLGIGAPIVVVQRTAKDGAKSDAADYRSQSAQEHRDEIRAAGCTPLLAAELDQVKAMTAALRTHPVAATLLDADHGRPEVSAFWLDPQVHLWCRARFDWLPDEPSREGRYLLSDLKTSLSADPNSFARSAGNYGYHQQAAWYLDGFTAITGDPAAFLFIVIEKSPPYLVSVVELDADALRIGRARNRRAVELYADCLARDEWPGYSADVELVSLPRWATYQEEEAS